MTTRGVHTTYLAAVDFSMPSHYIRHASSIALCQCGLQARLYLHKLSLGKRQEAAAAAVNFQYAKHNSVDLHPRVSNGRILSRA